MIRSLVLALALVAVSWAQASGQGMVSSKHNLSVSGSGPVRALSETQICVFCHTPHNANPGAPLWNRSLSGATYTPYASGSLQATVGQPNGYSRLCLSCHDGTIGIGSVNNLGAQSATINMQGAGPGGVMPPGNTLIGTNLTNDHPVSFLFNDSLTTADGELVSPSVLTGPIRLYEGASPGVRDSVQCTTCHDPHLTLTPKFLKKPLTGRTDNLCLTCHVKPGWSGSSHESATAKFFPLGSGTSVAELSCSACHTPHTKAGAPRLLREGATSAGAPAIEETCYRCHAPTAQGGITFDVKTQFAKFKHHPIADYLGHEPVFTTSTPTAEAVLNTSKHVECPDCHNPHRVRARGTAGTGGVYEGMRAIDLAGAVVQDVTLGRHISEYEICFRCHGDTYATVIGTTVQGDPSGIIPTGNKRTEFQTANSAFHPVAGAGRNTSQNLNDQLSPNGLATSSVIRCTDCHNNNFFSGPSFRGVVSQYPANEAQPKGPHGSDRFNLLRARVWNVLPGPSSWTSANFDLCFHCHDVTRLTARRTGDGARTNFYDSINGKDNLHWVHLIDRVSKSQPVCKSCHYNIHSNVEASNTQYNVNGIVYSTPNATGIPTRLINFHPNVRPIGGRAKPEWWFNTSTKERRCYLQCHQPNGTPGGATMSGFQYRPPSGDLP
jgi:predicted CXXCH cytochrome family protein